MLVCPLSHWDLPICQGSIREGSAFFIGGWTSQEGSRQPIYQRPRYPKFHVVYSWLAVSLLVLQVLQPPMASNLLTEQVYSSRDRAGVAVSPSSHLFTLC